jgi:hypothetical protein
MRFKPIRPGISELIAGPCRIVADYNRGVYIIQTSGETIESGRIKSKHTFLYYIRNWIKSMGLS